MNKKLYITPTVITVEMESADMLATSGKISDSASGGVDVIMPGDEATVDQGKLMSLDDPHLWN